MLSYRHAFHAGNHGDVLKHLILLHTLEYMGRKEKPFFYVDTHAGSGVYPLDEGYTSVHREWEEGVGRLSPGALPGVSPGNTLPQGLERYRILLENFGFGSDHPVYPGSPAIARALLRPGDRGVFFELHKTDYSTLLSYCSGDKRFKVLKEDGLRGLDALIPPIQRRGCVLIDPSYELRDDYSSVVEVLRKALERFAGGVYLIWYPLLNRVDALELPHRILELQPMNACRVELEVGVKPEGPRGMYGSGMVILNPPWILKGILEEILPYLVTKLSSPGAGWKLEWITNG